MHIRGKERVEEEYKMGRHARKREDEGREGRRRVKVRKIPRKNTVTNVWRIS